MAPRSVTASTAIAFGIPLAINVVPSIGSTATSHAGPLPSPTSSPLNSIGASSFSPSPITTTPCMETVPISLRMASTAAWSPPFLSPRPTQRPADIAAASVTRTSSSARLRSGASRLLAVVEVVMSAPVHRRPTDPRRSDRGRGNGAYAWLPPWPGGHRTQAPDAADRTGHAAVPRGAARDRRRDPVPGPWLHVQPQRPDSGPVAPTHGRRQPRADPGGPADDLRRTLPGRARRLAREHGDHHLRRRDTGGARRLGHGRQHVPPAQPVPGRGRTAGGEGRRGRGAGPAPGEG